MSKIDSLVKCPPLDSDRGHYAGQLERGQLEWRPDRVEVRPALILYSFFQHSFLVSVGS